MQKALWIGLSVVLVALAGCSDDGSGGDEDDFDDIDVTAGADTGVIRGVVVDDSIVPIPGATVRVQNTELETTSTQTGAFGFSEVEPGTYFVEVSKAGYDTVQASVDVEAGIDRPPVLKVQLPRLPGSDPYVLPGFYHGFISCEYQVANLLGDCDQGQGLFGEEDNTNFLAVDTRTPNAVQVEVTWDHNQEFGQSLTLTAGACGDGAYCSPYGFGSNNICQTWGPSPLWCRSDGHTVTRSGSGSAGLTVQNASVGSGASPGISMHISSDCSACTPPETPLCGDACGVGIIVDQEYDIFMHAFYNFDPEADWLFVEDGAHPVPDG